MGQNMSHSKAKSSFTLEEAIGRAAIAIVAHPFDYVKVLIQLGYEPLPSFPTKTIFGRTKLALPGVFTYLSFIRRQDGFRGMFRGLTYKIAYTLINGYVYVNTCELIKDLEPRDELRENKVEGDGEAEEEAKDAKDGDGSEGSYFEMKKVKQLFERLMRETLCKFVALSLSYPFQVLVVRCCAQFAGKEEVYDTFTGAVTDVYRNGGVMGFYSGFMPRFLGDCLILWTSHGLIFVIKGFLVNDSTLHGYISASINFVVTSIMYPFQVVSTVMAVNGPAAATLDASRLSGKNYVDWAECWRHLSQMGHLKRGSSLVWRYEVTPKPQNSRNNGYTSYKRL